MNINVNMTELAIFFSVFLRVSIIFFMLPMFSSSQLPATIKVCAVASLSFMLLPFIHQNVQPLPLDPTMLASVIVGEVLFASVYTLSMIIIIGAFQFAGELISFEMGFGFAQVADPQTGTQFTVLSVWGEMLALLVFFAMNGHHYILKLIVESFKTIPVGAFSIDSILLNKMLTLSGMLFTLAIKLSAPVVAVLILTQLGLGLMSKFAPQINILATSFPITITIGILFMGLMVAVWGEMAGKSFSQLFQFLGNLSLSTH
ncbi:MAG: flagellar biosynthetic protein FliR [Syntrophobacter sp.]